jgi:hypothetical protein
MKLNEIVDRIYDITNNLQYIKSVDELIMRSSNLFTKEQIEWYYIRTHKHINLVHKYCKKIYNANIFDNSVVNICELARDHDLCKFEYPELLPYIAITRDYKLKDEGKKVNLSTEEKIWQNTATGHHVRNNQHHPEYWDENFKSVPLNDRDSKTVKRTTDGTKMPLISIAEMVADWCAMSEEKGTNPYDWANSTIVGRNINARWQFTDTQKDLIYKILNEIWD